METKKFQFPQDCAFKIFARLRNPDDQSNPFRTIRYSQDKRGSKIRPDKGLQSLLRWFEKNWVQLPQSFYFVLAENKENGVWQSVFSTEGQIWQPYEEWKRAEQAKEAAPAFRFPQDCAFKIFSRLKRPENPLKPFRVVRHSPDKQGNEINPTVGLEKLLAWFEENWPQLPESFYFVLAENHEKGDWQAVFSTQTQAWQSYDEWKTAQENPEKPVSIRSKWRILIKYDPVIINYRRTNGLPANDLWYNQPWMDREETLLERLRNLRHVQEIVVWDNAAPPASRQPPYCRICPRTLRPTKPIFNLQSV